MWVDGETAATWGGMLLADGQVIRVEYQLVDGGGPDDPPTDPPANDTGNTTTTEPYPDPGDGTQPDDVGGIPALSLLVTTIALTLIALRRRRSD